MKGGAVSRGLERVLPHLYGTAEAAAFLGLCATAASLFAPLHWGCDALSHFHAILAGAFLLYTPIEWVRRRPLLLAASLVCALLNIWPVASLFFSQVPPAPDLSAASPGQSRLRLLQANILTSNLHPERLLALIGREDPDVILLQETGRRWLNALLPLHRRYPVHAEVAREDNFGIAVFAKAESARASIFYPDDPVRGPAGRIDLKIAGRDLSLFSVHTPAPFDRESWIGRDRYTLALARYLAPLPGLKIVTGDFNNTPWNPLIRDFARKSRLLDSTRQCGILPTWPVKTLPFLRIPLDQAFHSPTIRLLRKERGPDIGSDHFPLLLDFAIAPCPQPGERE